ncbi:MAG TPA: ATP-binding protein [Pyrinomonadaceae bacterium]
MSIRAKLLVVFIVLGLVPMLLLSVAYYRGSTRTVEGLLREDATARAAQARAALTIALGERAADLRELTRAPALRAYLRDQTQAAANTTAPASPAPNVGAQVAPVASNAAPSGDLRAALGLFIESHPEFFTSVTVVGPTGRALVRAEPPPRAGDAAVVKSGDVLPPGAAVDERVWAAQFAPQAAPLLRGPMAHALVTSLRYTLPVWAEGATEGRPAGAIVAELKLDALLDQVEAGLAEAGARGAPRRFLVVLDRAGQIVYHTNTALKLQTAGAAVPGFEPVARAMTTGESGAQFFATNTGERWCAAYGPVPDLDLSVAVATDAAAAGAAPRVIGLVGVALTILVALAAAVVLTLVIERTSRRIHRVAEAAAEIAAGNLEQRIEVRSTDETRLLAESFNLMSDRLREHIARETETKQFQSFLRLSAMLAHDLKNSITGLSMLVSNMERHLHKEEFRADAISSLRAATDKLRGIVARLNEPALTLSGEYRQAIRETDLVPLIRRVVAAMAEPAAALHHIETELPDKLVAPVDAERIERVLENLILNALEAMGGKAGRLSVTAGRADEWHVFLRVCDTGVGMSEEYIRTRLFRPFATTKEKGIGLGLYTCREVVAAHGGRLEVQSEVGAGTCFRVVLPSTPITRPSHPSAVRSQQTTGARGARGADHASRSS